MEFKDTTVRLDPMSVSERKKSVREAARQQLNEQQGSGLFTDETHWHGLPAGGAWLRPKDFLLALNPGVPISLFGEGYNAAESLALAVASVEQQVMQEKPNQAKWSGPLDGPSPMDISQGSIGDCYLLASLSAVAEEPTRIVSLFANEAYDESTGRYTVVMWVNGEWVAETVDDRFYVRGGKPVFCGCKGTNKIWAMLYEKAYCKRKFQGDWEKLGGGGLPYTVLHALLGASSGSVRTEGLTKTFTDADLFELLRWHVLKDKEGVVVCGAAQNLPFLSNFLVFGCLWRVFSAFLCYPFSRCARSYAPPCFDCVWSAYQLLMHTANWVLALACCPFWDCYTILILLYNLKMSGIVQSHAYAIIDVAEVPIGCCCAIMSGMISGPDKIVKLRNPWGTGEWKGAYSDKSCFWTAAGRKCVDLEAAEDGAFWIRISDFRRYFSTVCIAPYKKSAIAKE